MWTESREHQPFPFHPLPGHPQASRPPGAQGRAVPKGPNSSPSPFPDVQLGRGTDQGTHWCMENTRMHSFHKDMPAEPVYVHRKATTRPSGRRAGAAVWCKDGAWVQGVNCLCDFGQVPVLSGLSHTPQWPQLTHPQESNCGPWCPFTIHQGPLLQPSSLAPRRASRPLTSLPSTAHLTSHFHLEPHFSEGLSADADFTSLSPTPCSTPAV